MKLKKLINRLIDNAIMEPFVSSIKRRGNPGERIKQLKPEERELLVTAKPKDFEDFRREYMKLFIGVPSDETVIIFKNELEKKFNRRKI